ncbi:MAG: efflux RND transporter periplasmic adaptor subunit [Gammaproteobacteria bacterium]|nr:efflux RND transporter periplasmic adaptor subunit [Gammaproteobacteria bacterium]
MRAYVVAILLLLVIFGSIGGYLYQRFGAFAAMDFSPPPVTIAASTATLESWDETLSAVGTIQAVRGVELTSESSGEATRILFNSGDHVSAGELLVVLNDEVEQASRQNQLASLELAELLFDRDRALVEQRSIPQTQFDRTKADLERARAQLLETDARLANKSIRAPFAGTIGVRRINVGDYLSPGTVIATLQDHSELEIDFTVPARHTPKLRAGLRVAVSVDAYPSRMFGAVVAAVDARVDPNTRNILLRARLTEVAGLLPGMFAVLDVDLGEQQQVIAIPETAMTYALQGNTVYVIEPTADGQLTATARIVRAGRVRDSKVAVLEGLNAGDRVVSVGQNKLYRGVRVVVDESVQL